MDYRALAELRHQIRRFLTFSLIGGISWICSMTLTGYYLGTRPWADRYLHLIIATVIVVSFIPAAVEVLRERRQRRKQQEAATTTPEGEGEQA